MTEDQIEQMTLDFFRDLGWEVRHGAEISGDVDPHAVPNFDFATTGERDFEQVVLEKTLKRKITEFNPRLPYDKQDEVVKRIVRNADNNDILNNRDFHLLLTDGVDYEYRDESGNIRTEKAHFFDFKNPENNDFLAVNQLTVVQDGVNKRPDIVLFVNGLPIGVIELKNAASAEADLSAAYNQIQTYRTKISNLFRFNEVCITSDGIDARAGTFSAPENRFVAWKTIDGETELDRTVEIETLVRGMCEKTRFMDTIKNFIIFEKDERMYAKKLAAYHQYWVVNKALASTEKAMNSDHRAGVVWHTQGSGKSLSMVFYSGKLIGSLTFSNPTIVVVTDRNDLDGQLFETFTNCDDILRQKPIQAESRDNLRKLLDRESGGVIFTTIQKFAEGDGSISDRKNIIVIADEAHRSQYGLKARVKESGELIYGTAKYMRDALPNANYIGFTGTPIELDDRSTPAVFGDYIDIYDISQAEKDGATVKIFYESRLVDLGLDDDTRKWMDDNVDELFEGVEMDRSEKLKAEAAQKEAIIGNTERLKLIAKDTVDHFEKRLAALDGKGMIVCFSRQIAAQLYAEIINLRPDWHSDDDKEGFIKVVMTGSSSDPTMMQQHIRNKTNRRVIEKRFKNEDSDLKLVIVCDMWLTGFDVPSLHTMYLDKPLKAHNLMQAIARVNRVSADKTGGLVVDYLGVASALRDAMATYASSGGKGKPTVDIGDAVNEMLRRVEIVRDLFHGFDYDKFFAADTREKLSIILDAEEHVLNIDDGEARLKREVTGLYKAFALAVPSSEAIEIREEVAFFQTVKVRLEKTADGEGGRLNDKGYKMELRQIVDKAIEPLGIVDIFEAAGIEKKELPLLGEEFLAEIRDYKRKSLAVRALERLLSDEIRTVFGKNAIKMSKFSELIKKALDRYKNGTIEAAQVIEELIDIARKVRTEKESENNLGLTVDEIAFYDALIDNGSAKEVLGDEKLREIARYLVEKVRKNITTDWSVRESARAQLKYEVRVALNKFGYPPDKQAIATERVLEQAETLGNSIVNGN